MKEPAYNSLFGLVAFDIDGTLTRVKSSWQFIHERLGTWERGRAYEEDFRKGRITFSRWAELDVSLWRGLSSSRFVELALEVPLVQGIGKNAERLKSEGFVLGTISSCVPSLSDRLKVELDLDFAVSNSFSFKRGGLHAVRMTVTCENKDSHLRKMARKFSARMARTVAVGDSWVDAKMVKAAGLGIAFNPEDEGIKKAAKIILRGDDLEAVTANILQWKSGFFKRVKE